MHFYLFIVTKKKGLNESTMHLFCTHSYCTFVQQYKVCSQGTLLHRDFLLNHLSLSLISLPISPPSPSLSSSLPCPLLLHSGAKMQMVTNTVCLHLRTLYLIK